MRSHESVSEERRRRLFGCDDPTEEPEALPEFAGQWRRLNELRQLLGGYGRIVSEPILIDSESAQWRDRLPRAVADYFKALDAALRTQVTVGFGTWAGLVQANRLDPSGDQQSSICIFTSSGSAPHQPAQLAEIDVGRRMPRELILQRLGDASTYADDRRGLVIEAEAIDFTAEQERRLVPILRDFALKFRDSQDPVDLTAVGSAIRKLVAIIPVSEIGWLAELLESGHRTAILPSIKLEVAKMVYRKFAANPPSFPDPEPTLATRFVETGEAFLNPQILPLENYAAVALNALLALAAMNSHRIDDVLNDVCSLPQAWFRQQFCRRLRALCDEWRGRSPVPESAITFLRQIIEKIPMSAPSTSCPRTA